MPVEIGDHAETRGGDHDRHDGETVETVGQVDRVAGADDDEGAEEHEEPAEIEHHVLEEGNRQRSRGRVAAEPHQRVAGGERDHAFDQQPKLAGKAAMGLLGHLQIVVIEADKAEAERHREHDPDIGVERIGPQQRRDHEAGQDHQPAHRRRALLGDEVRCRAVGADRLALALAQPQMIDDPGPEQEHEQRARHHRPAGAEGDVAEHVEEAAEEAEAGNGVGKLDQPVKHSICPIPRLGRARLAGKAPASALTIVFILEPSELGHDRRHRANACGNSGQSGQFTPLPAGRPEASARTC